MGATVSVKSNRDLVAAVLGMLAWTSMNVRLDRRAEVHTSVAKIYRETMCACANLDLSKKLVAATSAPKLTGRQVSVLMDLPAMQLS
jgi:hypothetical protein